jgi:hypothetical protein
MKIHNSKAQAVAEMAILGSLLLIAFSALLVYGQRFELQQKIKMEAFRNALSTAYAKNSAISYTLKRDLRLANLFSGLGEGQESSLSASCSVMWQKGSPGSQGSETEQSFAYYQINDNTFELERKEKEVISKTGAKQKIWGAVGVWKEENKKRTEYNSTLAKKENAQRIENTQTAKLQETIENTLYTRFDQAKIDTRKNPWEADYYPDGNPNYVDTSTKYSSQGAYLDTNTNRIKYGDAYVGNIITKQRTWKTENTD